jgi:hypothetical protein
MNIYFLVEGKKELKIYLGWLSQIVPKLKQVQSDKDVKQNNYFIFNGGGLPSIFKQISPSISKINKINNYNYFVICVDAENATIEQRISKINVEISKGEQLSEKTKLITIVQNRCIETWFLGNRNVYTEKPINHQTFIEYSKFYNVAQNDPELMTKPDNSDYSIANFHKRYLKAMLHERMNKEDSQFHEEKYLNELKKRVINTPTHLQTFTNFLNFCSQIRTELSPAN